MCTLTTLTLEKIKAKRSDSGKYSVVVENSTGSRKGFCQVNVVGKYYLTRRITILFFPKQKWQ